MATTLEDLLPTLAAISRERGERRSLAELAAEVGRSRAYFQRAFSRIVRESPKRYTRRLQLECAAALLLTTDRSVLQVALESGFESHEGFTRAFAAHFGRAPKDFRAQRFTLLDPERHAALLSRVGPCLQLFRTPLNETRPMHYDITKQSIPETTFLHKSARCEQSKIKDALAGILGAVYRYATTHGIEMVSPPMTLYVQYGPGVFTFKAGMAVAAGTKGGDGIEVEVLPAGEAAVTVHTGPYDGLGDAHAAVDVFLHDQGLSPAGPLREIYVTDPGEVPDPADWKTQLVWPCRGA